MHYLIIGGGVASVAAIEGIRKNDKKGAVTLVCAEDVPTYGRPLISYYLAGKIDADRLALRPKEFWKKNKVDLRLGTTVTALDTTARTALLSDGETLAYDRCLLATGGRPSPVDLDNIQGPDVHHFTTLAHAQALLDRAGETKRAAVVGAGLIALKAAEGLAARGVEVTLVVRSRIMRAYFDETAGDMLVKHLEKKGIKFLLGQTPKAVVRGKGGRVTGLRTDKAEIKADIVVLAAGVRPDTGLARAAGIKTDKGILVNDRLMTSAQDVYAAGDAAEAVDLITGERRVIPIWPNAYHQGDYAGRNMAGENAAYPGTLSMNSIAYFGLPTQSVGLVNPPLDKSGRGGYETFSKADKRGNTYRKLVFQGDRLVGYVLIGDIDDSGIYTSFVEFGFPLDEEKKDRLKKGEAGVLLWPKEFFDQKWNPKRSDMVAKA